MKKFTNSIKALALLLLILSAKLGVAQCAANFVYSVGANGVVTFTSTSTLASSVSTTYYWSYGNGGPTFTATGTAGMFTNNTYTANGNYVVNLFILSIAPSCSNAISYTINVNTVGTGTCNLVANNGYSQGSNGLVNFNNSTTGTVSGTTYFWNFGNGNTSTAFAPSTTYTANGTYIATLTANNNFTSSCISTKTVNVVVNTICNLNANFSAIPGSNGNVAISNLTTPSVGVTYTWTYGSASSNLTNPTITFNANGTYTITLVAHSTSPNCTSTISSVVAITNVTGCNLTASFTASQAGNGLVNFNNTSSGTASTTTYSWSFGNGNTSTSTSPANTYTSNGSYLVTLNANNNTSPSCTSTKTLMVNVTNICALVANYNYTVGNNGSVSFANVSTNTLSNTSYLWNFGDNTTSNLANPANHTYATGVYNVMLTLTNFSTFPTCMDTVMHIIYVTNTCVANANFSLSPTGTPKFWNAIPANTANISAAQWTWGDGSTSNSLFTSHLYSLAATYTICLSTTVSCGATANYCGAYYINKSTSGADNEIIEVNVIDASWVGLKNIGLEKSELTVYPNPNNGSFNISMKGLNDNTVKLSVYNLVGQLVNETEVTPVNGNINKNIELNGVTNSGIYLVKVSSGNNSITRKVTVVK